MPTIIDPFLDKYKDIDILAVQADPTLLNQLWDRLLFVAGRGLQSREVNEMISVMEHYLIQLGRSNFDEGDRFLGNSPHVHNSTEVIVDSGVYFVKGKLRYTPPGTVIITGSGMEQIGIKVTEDQVSELEDTSLRNPATGLPDFDHAGAYRQRYILEWVLIDGDNAIPVYDFVDGVLQEKDPSKQVTSPDLEQRTYEESGHYKVYGFSGSLYPKDVDNLTLKVDGGLAYVKGRRTYVPTNQGFVKDWPKARTTTDGADDITADQPIPILQQTSSVPQYSLARYVSGFLPKNPGWIWPLAKTPVANVLTISATVASPIIKMVRGSGSSDTLTNGVVANGAGQPSPGGPATPYALVNEGTLKDYNKIRVFTSYLDTVDPPLLWDEASRGSGPGFVYDRGPGDTIVWSNPPPTGAYYYVVWPYSTLNGTSPLKLQKVRRTKVTAESVTFSGAATGVKIGVLANKDVLAVTKVTNAAGTQTYVEGQHYSWNSGRMLPLINNGILTFFDIAGGTSVKVDYEYWSVVDPGDVMTVNSYFDLDGVTPASADLINIADARGGVSNFGVSSSILPSSAYSGNASDSIDFRPANGRRPLNGTTVAVTYNTYLPRMDVVTLTPEGDLNVVLGASSNSPSFPITSADEMTLFYISSPPNSSSPTMREAPHVRHTMDDLISLRRRIEDLELQTSVLNVTNNAAHQAGAALVKGAFTDAFFDFSAIAHNFSAPAYKADDPGVDQNGLGVEAVTCNVAVSPLSKSIRLPFEVTYPVTGSSRLADKVSVVGTSHITRNNQIAMLDYTEEAELQQPQASDAFKLNPYKLYKPILDVYMALPIDPWVETNEEPQVLVPLNDAERTSTQTYVPNKEITKNPTKLLSSRYFGWWNEFHIGQSTTKENAPLNFATATNYTITPSGELAGALGQTTQLNQSGLSGIGFASLPVNIRKRTITEKIGDAIVSRDILPMVRSHTTKVFGNGFPQNVEVAGYFGGQKVALTGLSGTTQGTVDPQSVKSDNSGKFTAQFTIPTKIPVGEILVEMKCTDPSTGTQYIGTCTYIARSQVERVTSSYNSVASYQYDTTSALFTSVAQSFISSRDGFITSVDLFFQTKDSTRGIQVEVRDMANGVPGNKVLGKSFVAAGNVAVSNDGSAPTKFLFLDPVFVRGKLEYCFVIRDDTGNATIWTGQPGAVDIGTGNVIGKQPASGIMFESSNGKSWTGLQESDIKYTIRYARFPVTSGTLLFDSISIPPGTAAVGTRSISLSLISSQFFPCDGASKILWSVSVDGGSNWISITPGSEVNFNTAFNSMRLRGSFVGTSTCSPVVNMSSLELFAYANSGAEVGGLLQGDYVSSDVILTVNKFNTVKVVTKEFVPAGASIEAYFSPCEGSYWIPMSQGDPAINIDAGSAVNEVVRSITMIPFTGPGTPAADELIRTWFPSMQVALGTYLVESVSGLNANLWVCVSTNGGANGTTSSTKPSALATTASYATTVNDGTVIWRYIGPWSLNDGVDEGMSRFRVRLKLITDHAHAAVSPQVSDLRVVVCHQ